MSDKLETFHDDDSDAEGNVTAKKYDASYDSTGTDPGHYIPQQVIDSAMEMLDREEGKV